MSLDNRDFSEVDRYQSAAIEALRRRVKELEKKLAEKSVDAVASRRIQYYEHDKPTLPRRYPHTLPA